MIACSEPPISSDELSEFIAYKNLLRDEDSLNQQGLDLKEKLELLYEEERKYLRDYQVMRFWEKAFSEQGLIKYVIRNILTYFNEKCNYYLSYVTDGNFHIVFDEELNETITNNQKEVNAISLSGGERRKISFAILLALKSLLTLTGKVQSNILLVDEIGENLDSEGVEGLYNLLQELKRDKTIFLITHDKNLKTLFDSCSRISVFKEGDYSKIYRKDAGD